MNILDHHIYEIRKDLRRLALHTTSRRKLEQEIEKISRMGIACLARPAGMEKVNLFLGRPECLAVVESFGDGSLCRLTPEQDFMLGTLLGYGLEQQCRRYLERGARSPLRLEESPARAA